MVRLKKKKKKDRARSFIKGRHYIYYFSFITATLANMNILTFKALSAAKRPTQNAILPLNTASALLSTPQSATFQVHQHVNR